jgi:hypothetical protein
MANNVITNVDLGRCVQHGRAWSDELLAFAGTDTFVEGTILARRRVATAVTASAITGTGNGTVTVATVKDGPIVPMVGAYVLRCIAAVAHGGVFRLEDPNGAIVAGYLALTAGAGVATVFEAGGLQFTITDGSTDFVVGDTATLTVAADGKLVPFNPAGVGGEQFPLMVLPYEVTRTGSGNVAIRALAEGDVNRTRLVIDVDGHGNNVTASIVDQLRAAGINATATKQLSELDNQ